MRRPLGRCPLMSRRIIFDIYWATLIPERVAQYKYLGQEGADDSGKELKEALSLLRLYST
jgi:hypothetical protein